MKTLESNCPICRFNHVIEVEDDCIAVQDIICPTCYGSLHPNIYDYDEVIDEAYDRLTNEKET